MEPVTTTTLIGTVVGYLAKKLSDSKSFQDFTNEFSEATIQWIRPIFLKDDAKPKDVLENLLQKPESEPRQKAAKTAIEVALEDNPHVLQAIEEMAAVINRKKARGESITISNSKNVNTGTINAGGGVLVGDHSHQYNGSTVHGSHHGHMIQGNNNNVLDVGLDRAVGAVGKEVSKATSTTINLAVKVLVIGGILLSILGYVSYKSEQESQKESEIQAYNESVARLKSDIVNLKRDYPNSPIQTLSDFANFKIENTIESERRKEFTVSFTNSPVSHSMFSGRMIMTYTCGDDEVFFKNFILSEFKDISAKPIFKEKPQPEPQPEPQRQTNHQLNRPEDQAAELLKLMGGFEANYVGIVTSSKGLNIRDVQGNVLATMPYNARVLLKRIGQPDVVDGEANYWCWVDYNGIEGWAWMRWIN